MLPQQDLYGILIQRAAYLHGNHNAAALQILDWRAMLQLLNWQMLHIRQHTQKESYKSEKGGRKKKTRVQPGQSQHFTSNSSEHAGESGIMVVISIYAHTGCCLHHSSGKKEDRVKAEGKNKTNERWKNQVIFSSL